MQSSQLIYDANQLTGLCKIRRRRPDVFCQKGFLEISQNLQESTCARVSFNKEACLRQHWHLMG